MYRVALQNFSHKYHLKTCSYDYHNCYSTVSFVAYFLCHCFWILQVRFCHFFGNWFNPYQNIRWHLPTFIFSLFDCARTLHAIPQHHSLTKENFFLGFYCSDFKHPKCFYNELLAFYLNRSTCWQMSTARNNTRSTKKYAFLNLKLLWMTVTIVVTK